MDYRNEKMYGSSNNSTTIIIHYETMGFINEQLMHMAKIEGCSTDRIIENLINEEYNNKVKIIEDHKLNYVTNINLNLTTEEFNKFKTTIYERAKLQIIANCHCKRSDEIINELIYNKFKSDYNNKICINDFLVDGELYTWDFIGDQLREIAKVNDTSIDAVIEFLISSEYKKSYIEFNDRVAFDCRTNIEGFSRTKRTTSFIIRSEYMDKLIEISTFLKEEYEDVISELIYVYYNHQIDCWGECLYNKHIASR